MGLFDFLQKHKPTNSPNNRPEGTHSAEAPLRDRKIPGTKNTSEKVHHSNSPLKVHETKNEQKGSEDSSPMRLSKSIHKTTPMAGVTKQQHSIRKETSARKREASVGAPTPNGVQDSGRKRVRAFQTPIRDDEETSILASLSAPLSAGSLRSLSPSPSVAPIRYSSRKNSSSGKRIRVDSVDAVPSLASLSSPLTFPSTKGEFIPSSLPVRVKGTTPRKSPSTTPTNDGTQRENKNSSLKKSRKKLELRKELHKHKEKYRWQERDLCEYSPSNSSTKSTVSGTSPSSRSKAETNSPSPGHFAQNSASATRSPGPKSARLPRVAGADTSPSRLTSQRTGPASITSPSKLQATVSEHKQPSTTQTNNPRTSEEQTSSLNNTNKNDHTVVKDSASKALSVSNTRTPSEDDESEEDEGCTQEEVLVQDGMNNHKSGNKLDLDHENLNQVDSEDDDNSSVGTQVEHVAAQSNNETLDPHCLESSTGKGSKVHKSQRGDFATPVQKLSNPTENVSSPTVPSTDRTIRVQTPSNPWSQASHLPKRTNSTPQSPVLQSSKEVLEWCSKQARSNLHVNYVPDQLIGLETEYKELMNVVESAISNGENNSILLIGDRGSGKSLLLNSVLKNLESKTNKSGNRVLKVQLNGLVQTDDAMAIKEISRQLALDELWNESRDQENIQSSMKGRGSFVDHLNFILEILRELSQTQDGCPVVFVLDEFDVFARRHKQTLLYNLFDLTQSKDSKIVVIGLTNRLDAVEQMEKRVKSRFSERQLLISQPSLDQLVDILLQRLVLEAPEDWPEESKNLVQVGWNAQVKKLFQTSHSVLQFHHMMGYSIGWFLNLIHVTVSRLRHSGRRSPYLQVSDLSKATKSMTMDLRLSLLSGLSTVELVLVVAMIHLEQKEQSRYNFQMVFDYVERTMAKNDSLKVEGVSKQVGMKAFERLLDLKLIATAKDIGGQLTTLQETPKEFIDVRLMVDPDEILEGISSGTIPCSTQLQMLAHKQL